MANKKTVDFLEQSRLSAIGELDKLTFLKVDPITIDRAALDDPTATLDRIKALSNKEPVLYFFKIKNRGGLFNVKIAEEYKNKKEELEKESLSRGKKTGFSAVNLTKINSKSDYLYVGKVRKGVGGRLMLHLGFAKDGETQGMRLNEWLPEGITLELYCYYLNLPKYPFLVDLFEEYLKKELKPIIGVK